MQLRVDGESLDRVVLALHGLAVDSRELSGCARQLDDGLADVAVAGGLHLLGGSCASALELVALDLGLVCDRIGAAARSYDAVERTAATAAQWARGL